MGLIDWFRRTPSPQDEEVEVAKREMEERLDELRKQSRRLRAAIEKAHKEKR